MARQTTYKILIAHPERQHSHNLALALGRRGVLGHYVYGAPLPQGHDLDVFTDVREQVRFCRMGRVLAQALLPPRMAAEQSVHLWWSFDALIARRLAGYGCQAVVGYENSALATFRQAKRLGTACILDHASVHHSLQDRMVPHDFSERLHRRIAANKDEELALADLVLTCSSFAADSFVAAGVPKEKLRILPLGCDTNLGHNSSNGVARQPDADGIRFLFVGRLHRLKGADLLAVAVSRLRDNGVACRLTVAASLRDADNLILKEVSRVGDLLGKVPHAMLRNVYEQADCLVVPSRFDSFALVVAEALASGIPVIVSDHVGAKDMIVEGVNGWIVPADDADALFERMRWCADNVASVRRMQRAVRQTAVTWSWDLYYIQAFEILDAFMTSRLAAAQAISRRPRC